MKKLVTILLIFCSCFAFSQDYRSVDWKTKPSDTRVLNTDTFKVTVVPINYSDKGVGEIDTGYFLIDWVARAFEIIDFENDTVTVVDLAGENIAPTENQIANIYQSIVSGDTLFRSIGGTDASVRDELSAWKEVARNNELFGRAIQTKASKTLLASKIGTSIHWGGELTINTDPTKFDIADGSGHIVDNYTDPQNPNDTIIEWTGLTGITDEGIGLRNLTFISINRNGEVVQRDRALTVEERRDEISIGTNLVGASNILSVANVVQWNADIFLTFTDFVDAIGGRFNIEGNIYSPFDGNNQISRTAGEMYGTGLNYGIDKQTPNIVTSIAESPITFFLAYRGAGGSPSIVSVTDTIPTDKYDPNGDGTLVDIPFDYCVAHRIYFDPVTNVTAIQYGQFAYDSQKKAVNSYEKEDFEPLPEVGRVPLRCVLVVCKGTADLSERDDATFINVSLMADNVYDKIPDFPEYAEPVELLDGMSYKQQSIYFTDDGANVYLEVERNPVYGGGDMTYVLGQREFTLDCTTGTGVNGRAKIQLLLGSDEQSRLQYVYITRSGEETVALNVSESKPTGEYAMLWRGALRSYSKYVEDGMKPFTTQRYTQAKEKDGVSMVITTAEKLRAQGAETSASYGPVPLIEIVQDTPDSLNVDVSSGGVYQLYYQIFQSLSSKVDGIRVLNPHANETFGALDYIYNLADIQYDAAGNTLNNRSFNFVFVGAKNSANGDSIDWIGVNLPSDTYTYNSTESAITNLGGYAVTSVPTEADQVAFLLGRVTFRYKNGDWENLTLSQTGLNYFDLRGQPLGTTSGGTGTPSPTPVFNDNTFQVENASDATKIFKVNVGTVTTGNTRTLNIPDKSGTIALIDDLHPALTKTGAGAYGQLDGINQVLNLDQIDYNTDIINTPSTLPTSSTWQDVIDNGTATVTNSITTGGLTSNGSVTLAEGGQDYLFTKSGNNLAIQGQSSGSSSAVGLFSKDGDGTDFNQFIIYGKGTPSSTTNSEFVDIRQNGTTAFEMFTFATGTGTLRPLILYTGSNANQLKLETDGSTSFSSNVSASTAPTLDPHLTNKFYVDNLPVSTFTNDAGYITDAFNYDVQALSGTTPTLNATNGINSTITLTANTTITLQNLVEGMSGNITVTNASTQYTITMSGYTFIISPFLTSSGDVITMSGSSQKDVLSWYYDGTQVIINGTYNYL